MLRCLSCGNCKNFVIKGWSIFIYELVRFIVEKTHIQVEAFVLSPFIEGKTLSIGCGNGSVEALINKGIVGVEVLKYENPRIPIIIHFLLEFFLFRRIKDRKKKIKARVVLYLSHDILRAAI